MNPRIGRKGYSFKGAGQYYLHDKGKDTSERVSWTDTHNLPTKNPHQGIRHMIDLSNHADELKQAAGVKNTGCKSKAHVYTYSLAWAIGEQIDNETMKKACLESLRVLGVSKHQALFVRHNDTDHEHVHIILNRVDPKTGKLATLNNDRIKLSDWALDINARFGWKESEERIVNNKKRKKGEWVKHEEKSTRQEHLDEKARGIAFWKQQAKDRKIHSAEQLAERNELFKAKEEEIKAQRQNIKTAFKPLWAELLSEQSKEKAVWKENLNERMEARKKALEKQAITEYYNTYSNKNEPVSNLDKTHEAARLALAKRQGAETRGFLRDVNQTYQSDRLDLWDKHNAENRDFDRDQCRKIDTFKEANDNETTHDIQGRERTLEIEGNAPG